MDLQDLRQQIDRVDREIVKLYTERMEIADRIGAWKKENGVPVYDPAREEQLLDKVAELARPEHADGIRALFRCVLAQSRTRQEHITTGGDR